MAEREADYAWIWLRRLKDSFTKHRSPRTSIQILFKFNCLHLIFYRDEDLQYQRNPMLCRFHFPRIMLLETVSNIVGRPYIKIPILLASENIHTPHLNTFAGWPAIRSFSVGWRRERDSNPRSRFYRNTRFPVVPLRPLGHLSATSPAPRSTL